MLPFDEFVRRVVVLMALDPAPTAVDAAANLYEDWMLDSLQAFQLTIVIEAIAEVLVPPEELPPLFTLDDAYGYYTAMVNAPSPWE